MDRRDLKSLPDAFRFGTEALKYLRPICPFCGFEERASCWPAEYELLLIEHYPYCIAIKYLGSYMPDDTEFDSPLMRQAQAAYDGGYCVWCSHVWVDRHDVEEIKLHRRVCIQRRKDSLMGILADAPEVKSWTFSERWPHSVFKWDPLGCTRTVWVFGAHDQCGREVPMIGWGIPGATYDSTHTFEEAVAASKQYVLRRERERDAREAFAANPPQRRLQYGQGPSSYYPSQRANDPKEVLIRKRAELLVSMFEGMTVEKATLRLRILLPEELGDDWESVIQAAFVELSQILMAQEERKEEEPLGGLFAAE